MEFSTEEPPYRGRHAKHLITAPREKHTSWFHRLGRNMFLGDTVSKCVCSGLQKLINYPQCSGASVLLLLSTTRKTVFHPLSEALCSRLPGFCSVNSYGPTCWDIQGPFGIKSLGVNWTIVAHLFPIMHCYLGGSLKGCCTWSRPAASRPALCPTSVEGCISMSAL